MFVKSAFAVSALAALAVDRVQGAISCSSLWTVAPSLLPSLEVYVAQDYAANTTFSTPFASPAYNSPVPSLAAFCRFGAYIHTTNTTKVQFEVWFPLESEWSGRFAMVGNGGDAGGVNYPDMWGPLTKYHFAVASTDTGHNGTSADGTFALNGPQAQIDFGHRAVHLTAVYSKKLVKAFYGQHASYNYWIGCSSGGKQGLKELQTYPNTFDGVIAGAAAQWWTHLNGQTYRINALVNPVNSTGHLAATDYAAVGKLVLEQCDSLDGLKDGIITNPRKCKPDLSPLSCSSSQANQSSCLTQAKIDTMYKIYANWTSTTTGEWLFPGFEPGAEASSAFSVNGVPYGPAPDFFEYQVLNKTTVGTFTVANETEFEKLLKIADETDPGQTNAIDGYIEPYLKRGKLLTYVGLADTLIPTGSSLWYYEHVRQSLNYPSNLGDSYRLFTIPGMNHCSGGTSAYNFGGPGQRAAALNGTGQSSTFDKSHDMILAMIDWVEQGNAPDVLIGSKYVNNNRNTGIQFQRKHCPYPQEGVYIGGDANSADSFECKYIG
ncbi:tannase and feruloyl esterase [Meredithblackwellia eburnea MCA 4105]